MCTSIDELEIVTGTRWDANPELSTYRACAPAGADTQKRPRESVRVANATSAIDTRALATGRPASSAT